MTDQKDLLTRALRAIDDLEAKLRQSEARRNEPIAVVGMGCRFPGGVTSPATFWSLLREGRSGIREIPRDRWDVEAFYDPDPEALGKMSTRFGGFLDQVDRFDAAFFGISPREAITLDPQQRLLLEVAWEALENAAQSPERLVNSATGVYVGITASDYARMLRLAREDSDVYSATGTALNAAAGRLSFVLGLQGPSMAVDTACSSSLVATHLACQALRAGECDVALAGGVNATISPELFVLFSKWGMLAPDGRCRTFDAQASGFVRGEGCGLLVLKRLSDAIADGSRIEAVILGSAVNQDGPSSGLSVPNGLAQAKVIRRALASAGVAPADVDFVEAHGTGTILGDPIEVEALAEVYGQGRDPASPLLLGSVKPSIGHLESAAGVAGLMKLILSLREAEIPAQLNYREPNPRIAWERLPVRVAEQHMPWPATGRNRVGAVSGFGFSGTNAHMVVAAPPVPAKVARERDALPLLVLSAKNSEALHELSGKVATALRERPELEPLDVAHTLARGRSHFTHRMAVVGQERELLAQRLDQAARGEATPGTATGIVRERSTPRVAFLFTGQGSQYPGMGMGLYRRFPVIRDALDECDAALESLLRPSLLEVLRAGAAGGCEAERIHQTAWTQPALFSVEYAIAQQLRSWGVEPAAVLGHSIGEFVGATLAGVMSLDEALRLVAERGRLVQELPQGGGMLAVAADAETALKAARPFAGRVALAARNGPQDQVLSGPLEELKAIAEMLSKAGVDHRFLIVSHAFHSPQMDPILDRFEGAAAQVELRKPLIPLVSNLTGRPESAALTSPAYWRRQLREPVAFEPSMRALSESGLRVFVEVGPRPVLIGMARRFLQEQDAVWIPTLRSGRDEAEALLEALGALYTVGTSPEWSEALGPDARRVELPTYPFQRMRFWAGGTPERSAVPSPPIATPARHPLLGRRLSSPLREVQFECAVSAAERPFLSDHRVAGMALVPAAALIEMAYTAGTEAFATDRVRLEDGWFHSPVMADASSARDVHLLVSPHAEGEARYEVFSRDRDASDAAPWTSHAGGRVRRVAARDPSGEPVEVLRERCREPIDVAAYYAHLVDVGLEYGPTFRALVAGWAGEGEALGELQLPDAEAEDKGLHIHPGILDGAFHLIGLGLGSRASGAEDRFYLPVGFAAAEIYGAVGARALSHVKVREQSAGEMRLRADVSIYRPDGGLALRILGLELHRTTRARLRTLLGAGRAVEPLKLIWSNAPGTVERSASATDARSPGTWLVVGGGAGLAESVVSAFRAEGEHAERASAEHARARLDRASTAQERVRGIVDLRAIALVELRGDDATGAPPTEVLSRSELPEILELVRTAALAPPGALDRLVLVTRLAQAAESTDRVNPLAATLWGLGVTAEAELPGSVVCLLDLDDGPAEASAPAIVAEALGDSTRAAIRSGSRLVPRLVARGAAENEESRLALPEGAYQLAVGERGSLSGLTVMPAARRQPGPSEVEIEVMASGLNFRDVLNLLDLYPGSAGALGSECAGWVVAVGAGVEGVRAGDLVMCIVDGSFSSHVIADARMVFPIPAQLSVAQAAAFPIAQLTAWLALQHVGGMKNGDRVLIHAGAGGVGLAAVHLALARGAEVLASAGSEVKRAYLRGLGVSHVFDSRSPVFADAVRAVTGGHGVDLLLNSLTGEFIPEGLRSLAEGGSFMEIGLRELWTDEQVRGLREGVAYHALQLGDWCREDPTAVRAMYDGLVELLEARRIPPPRVHTFPFAEAPAAFRYMAKARHIGRVAFLHPNSSGAPVRPDGAYLITGGLGALGLHVAEWLCEQGASHLILMSRRPAAPAAVERIEAMRERGVRVEIVSGDVASPAGLAFLKEDDGIRPMLRGVVHAAGIVDDAALMHHDWIRFLRVLAAKADGAWNLMRATHASALDFTVFFSSGSALLGSPGQAAYAAANAFLDGLAHRLRAEGHAALSVNWGAWEGSGMAANVHAPSAQRWAARGVGSLAPQEALAALEQLLSSQLAQAAVLPIHWDRFLEAAPQNRPLLAELAPIRPTPEPIEAKPTEGATASALDALNAAPAEDRLNRLYSLVVGEVARVLCLGDESAVEPTAGFTELGMDSLMAMDLRDRLGRTLGIRLPATLIFEHPTPRDLVTHLAAELGVASPSEKIRVVRTEPSTAGADDDSILNTLNNDEIEAELLRELDRVGF